MLPHFWHMVKGLYFAHSLTRRQTKGGLLWDNGSFLPMFFFMYSLIDISLILISSFYISFSRNIISFNIKSSRFLLLSITNIIYTKLFSTLYIIRQYSTIISLYNK